MDNHLISIIAPVYNVEKFLPECLDSIINQTYQNIEIILVDDGSKDNSGQIADLYAKKDKRITVIHQDNSGVSSARNAGINIATGDYLCFVDSDDILMNDYVEYLYYLIREYNADISLTTRMFSSYGDHQTKEITSKVVNGEEAANAILHYFIPIGCYCKLFKRSLLNEGVRFIPEVYIGEGFNFNIEAFLKAKTVAIGNKKIYKYRRDNEQSAMTKFRADKCKMALHAIDLIRNKMPKNNKTLEEGCDYAMWHTASNMFDWIILAKQQKNNTELYNECKTWVKDYSFKALRQNNPKSDKLRAFLQCIHPQLLPQLLRFRRFIFLRK